MYYFVLLYMQVYAIVKAIQLKKEWQMQLKHHISNFIKFQLFIHLSTDDD